MENAGISTQEKMNATAKSNFNAGSKNSTNTAIEVEMLTKIQNPPNQLTPVLRRK